MNIGLCREREKRWREFAMTRTGVNRDACLELADGYAYLVAVLEQLGKTSNDVAFIPPTSDESGGSVAPH